MVEELLLRNGVVYDPLNGVSGERMDLCLKDGKVVSKVNSPKVIDLDGRLVMPGGVDGHSHIAGGKTNTGRIMRPEDSRKNADKKTALTRGGSGRTCPNVFSTGYRYALMGYTTVIEPAVAPMVARHVHEELSEIPIIDKATLTIMGNNFEVLKFIEKGDIDSLTDYMSWLLQASKSYGVKMVNPGGVAEWAFGKKLKGLDSTMTDFDLTPKQIMEAIVEANERLNLPHSPHVHINGLGIPGNYTNTLETLDVFKNMASKRDRQVFHLTHAMFFSFGGSSWKDFCSKADEIVDVVNKSPNLTIDMGQIVFGDVTTMTSDGYVQFRNSQTFKTKWANSDVEMEGGGGVTPLTYTGMAPFFAVMWGIGLELALLVKDPSKVFLTTDHPNGGVFTDYPEVITWLMSKEKRDAAIEKMHKAVLKGAQISSIDREMDFEDIAYMTRTTPSTILGLQEFGKGHLGIGADADVSVYDIKPEGIDPSKEHVAVKKGLQKALYTIKSGEVVVKDGKIVKVIPGKTLSVKPRLESDAREKLEKELKDVFSKYYTIQFSNYAVEPKYIANSHEIEVI